MIFDRLIEDALNFIRRLLWWRSNKRQEAERKPFASMRSHTGEWGIAHLVIGRDTPRAVRTWIYSPQRWQTSKLKQRVKDVPDDLHFYLDFLGPLPHLQTQRAVEERQIRATQRKRGMLVPTHRLQIFRASQFLNSEGFYDCDLIFWGDFDFQLPNSMDAKKEAMMVIDKLVVSCLRTPDPFAFTQDDWNQKINGIWNQIRGSDRQFVHKSTSRRSRSRAVRTSDQTTAEPQI